MDANGGRLVEVDLRSEKRLAVPVSGRGCIRLLFTADRLALEPDISVKKLKAQMELFSVRKGNKVRIG